MRALAALRDQGVRTTDVAILVDALRRIADGETVIDPTIVSRLVRRRRRRDPLDELTERGSSRWACRTRRSPRAFSSESGQSRRT
jgi:DNA-binding NarL/FixJ family response regulator